jgi:hypothetical protein
MKKVNKVKKVGDKITWNEGGLKGIKEYTIKKVVVREDRNRFEYYVSNTKSFLYPIREDIISKRGFKYTSIIGF